MGSAPSSVFIEILGGWPIALGTRTPRECLRVQVRSERQRKVALGFSKSSAAEGSYIDKLSPSSQKNLSLTEIPP